MTPGFLIYKCRRCNAERKGPHVPDIYSAGLEIINGEERSHPQMPALIELISCKCSSGLAVMDFVGTDKD